MKKSKFMEEQIAFALRQAETGTQVAEDFRKMRISEQTYFRWKKKYAGLGVSEHRCLRHLEEENKRLKRMVLCDKGKMDGMIIRDGLLKIF